jgi:hypothetical protein
MIARKSKYLFDARNSKSRFFKKENYFKVWLKLNIFYLY